VRRNAVQVLPPSPQTLAALLDANLLCDPDAQVRLMTFLAIADQPNGGPTSERAAAAICAALKKFENITDRWVPDAAVAAAAKHDASFLHEALAQSAKDNAGKPAPSTKPAPRGRRERAEGDEKPDHPMARSRIYPATPRLAGRRARTAAKASSPSTRAAGHSRAA
jgi:hypothetical protein